MFAPTSFWLGNPAATIIDEQNDAANPSIDRFELRLRIVRSDIATGDNRLKRFATARLETIRPTGMQPTQQTLLDRCPTVYLLHNQQYGTLVAIIAQP